MSKTDKLKAEIARLEDVKLDLLWGVRACLDDFLRREPDFKDTHRNALVINRLHSMLKKHDHGLAERMKERA